MLGNGAASSRLNRRTDDFATSARLHSAAPLHSARGKHYAACSRFSSDTLDSAMKCGFRTSSLP